MDMVAGSEELGLDRAGWYWRSWNRWEEDCGLDGV